MRTMNLTDTFDLLTDSQRRNLAAAQTIMDRERKPQWARARTVTRPSKRRKLAARRPHRRMTHDVRVARHAGAA